MKNAKDAGEGARWGVFLFVIIPMLPVGIVSFILGAAWAVAKEFFVVGTKVLDVWDGYEPEGTKKGE